jgi:hypothetical protein
MTNHKERKVYGKDDPVGIAKARNEGSDIFGNVPEKEKVHKEKPSPKSSLSGIFGQEPEPEVSISILSFLEITITYSYRNGLEHRFRERGSVQLDNGLPSITQPEC